MSHQPPVPGGAKSPYPLNAAQSAQQNHARHELAEQAAAAEAAAAEQGVGKPAVADAATTEPAADSGAWKLKVAAGTAIGSAAVAAALLYWNRSRAD